MKALDGQTLFDIAIQYCGSTDAAYELAVLNGISVTDDLAPGQELILPDVVDADVFSYFSNKGIQPATLLARAIEVSNTVDTVVRNVATIQSNLITVINGQTLIDIAIQEFGSIEAAFDLAVLNGISITDELIPGALLQKVAIVDKKIANYYQNKGIHPATEIQINNEGIFDYTFDYTFN